MQRIKRLSDAVIIAANVCNEWKMTDSTDFFDIDTMMEVAIENDTENPLDEDAFYIVTTEGAIGIAYKREYAVQWFFLPAEDFPEEKAAYEKRIEEAAAKLEESRKAAEQNTANENTGAENDIPAAYTNTQSEASSTPADTAENAAPEITDSNGSVNSANISAPADKVVQDSAGTENIQKQTAPETEITKIAAPKAQEAAPAQTYTDTTEAAPLAKRFCSNCGNKVGENAKFCMKCGQKL